MTREFRLVVIGDAMSDVYHKGHAGRVSPEGPHLVFSSSGEKVVVAGGAANVAANVRSLGAYCDLYSDFGPANQIVKERLVDRSGHVIVRIDTEPQPPAGHPSVFRLLPVVGDYVAVIISDYGKGTLDEESIASIARASRSAGVPTFADCCKGASPIRYKGIDFVKPNRVELSAMYPGLTVEDAAAALSRETGGCVMATVDADGSIFAESGRVFMRVRPSRVMVADVTGAGDTFVAAFAVARARGESLSDAACYATVASQVAVSMPGTYPVSSEEVAAWRGIRPTVEILS